MQLLDRWREGDRQAGNELFQRHFESINRFFENKVPEEVDELVQATFFALTKHRDQFRKQSSFRTYLFTIARNELYRHLRSRYKRELDFGASSLLDLATTPTGRIAKHQRKHRLVDALRSLPLEQQLLIELHYWEGIGFEDLASMFEVSRTTIRTRLFRARKRLRAQMEGERALAAEGGAEDALEAWVQGLAPYGTVGQSG